MALFWETPEMCLKMAEMASGYRFLPKLHMGRKKIPNVFCYFCPLTYLNRSAELQNPLKTGLKWSKSGSKTGKNSPLFGQKPLNLVVFKGQWWPSKSLFLDYWPWIGDIVAKMTEIHTFCRKVVKLAILDTFGHPFGPGTGEKSPFKCVILPPN